MTTTRMTENHQPRKWCMTDRGRCRWLGIADILSERPRLACAMTATRLPDADEDGLVPTPDDCPLRQEERP
jgi:hypothetical protein